jgi:hypothetical protein
MTYSRRKETKMASPIRKMRLSLFGHFRALPKWVPRETIYAEAGRVLERRINHNPRTDSDTDIWYLAEDAVDSGFDALSRMTTREVASEMGNYIYRYINARKPPPPPSGGRGDGYGGGGGWG